MTSVTTSLAAFAFVLAAIPVALWVLRRAGSLRPRQAGVMRLAGSLELGPRERITLVVIGERCLVVGQTAQSINLLAELPAGELATDGASPASVSVPSAAPFATSLLAALTRARGDARDHAPAHAPDAAHDLR